MKTSATRSDPPRGFVNIDKPAEMTSFDVVRIIRRACGVRRVGHAGTLDRPATGVLPVAIGDATRLVETLVHARKRYDATIVLGVETDTYDAAGTVVAEADASTVAAADVEAVLASFVGKQLQTPPAFSAVKLGGERAYRAARRGERLELQPRPVEVYAAALLDFSADDPSAGNAGRPRLHISVECGKGFYIRALAHDIGARLGVGGHVLELRRTGVGPFLIADAVPLELAATLLERGAYDELVHAPDAVLTEWPALVLGRAAVGAVRQGRDLSPTGTSVLRRAAAGTRARAYGPGGRLVALLEASRIPGQWHPYRVFAHETESQ